MSSLHLNTRSYDKRNRIINFILFLIIILLFAFAFYEVFQMKNENENYEKEIQTLEKENDELNKENKNLKQQNENQSATMSGSYAGSMENSTKSFELLLTNNGGVVLSTSENGTNECFYGGYTLEDNKINISLITGKNAYNGEVTPNNNIELTINEDKTITYKETDTNTEIVLEATALENFQNIGKIFKITTN